MMNDVVTKSDLGAVKGELKADIAELKANIAEIRTDIVEIRADIAEIRADIAGLERIVVKLAWDVRIFSIVILVVLVLNILFVNWRVAGL